MNAKPRILVTGGAGQVGTEFSRRTGSVFEVVTPGREELDLSSPSEISAYLTGQAYDAVINAGAYTAVDRAEIDPVSAWQVNALAPAAFAFATREARIPLIQLSTDYVFDGTKPSPYVEDDPVHPVSVYGASKQGGEQAVRTLNPRHIVLRTAWVVSAHGANFIKTMLRLAETRDQVSVVNDQTGCPTSAADIAEALKVITHRLLDDPAAPTGTYHMVGEGEATWWELARETFAVAERHGRSVPKVEPIPSSSYPTPARRPMNSRLNTAKLTRDFGFQPQAWRGEVNQIVGELLSPAKETQ